jgi:benzoyl-CoA reductase/2-hydroxyglutaryl-CoA dehydratase subunit BcrC/BadD/HgdB
MPYDMEMAPADYLEAMEYIKAQLLEIIAFSERTWPTYIKYDPAKLEAYQILYREFTRTQGDVLELLKLKPCPVSGRDALRMPPTQVYDDPRVTEYMRQFRDEFREKAARGEGAVKDNLEKFRVYWMCSAPFYEDPFGFLEEQGCAIPLYEEGPGVPCRYNVRDFEEAERRFGRRMRDPLEEEAAAFATCHWGATGDRRISEVLRRSREVGVEGIVHFMQPGCLPCNNIARVLGEHAEKELGIKNLYIEGWAQDLERHNEGEFESKLGDWLKVCLAEKEARGKA